MALLKQRTPPSSADELLGWFCKDQLLEEIKGDLHELYEVDLAETPKWRANLSYWYHVLHFLRPFALKSSSQNSNTVMIRSHFKFAWRNISKHKMSAVTNIVSLAVGIACFIFIFIYLKDELSYDRFHTDSERIHRIAIDFVSANGRIPDATTPPALAPALKRDFPEVETSVRLFPNWGRKFLFEVDGKKFYEEEYIRTDSTFFDVFDFKPLHGDVKTALDAPNQIVLTRSTAIKYFGDDDVVGKTMVLGPSDPLVLRVSAVVEDVPDNSHFKFDMLGRITFNDIEENWGWYNFYTYIKVFPNADMAAFEAKLQPFFEGYEDPAEYYNAIYSQRLTDIHLKSNLKWELEANGNIETVYILAGLALFVLLISCLNYLNLAVAESLKRFKEVGVRKVFGAHRKSLINQFLVETMLITIISLLLGCLFAEFLFGALQDLLGKPLTLFADENMGFLLGLAGFILLMGLLAGLYPAISISRFKTALAVKGQINRSGKSALGLRKVLLIIQFSLSAFMIFGTLTVYQQSEHIRNKDKGFSTEQVLVIENGTSIDNQAPLKTELQRLSQVNDVGVASGIIGGLNWTTGVGYPEELVMNYVVIDPGFIETLDLNLIAGRNFEEERETDRQGWNMIINETALDELGLTLDDVGKPIPLVEQNDDSVANGTIIGVVKDFHFTDFKLEIKPFAFFYRDRSLDYVSVKLNTADISETIGEIEGIWSKFTNGEPMEYFFMDQQFADIHAQENRLSKILMYLTMLAFFIAFVGMIAITRITIKDKRKEIAIRKVLGESVAGVTNLITSRFLILVIVANLVAVPVSYWLMNTWLDGFAYRTTLGLELFLVAIGSTILVATSIVGLQSVKAAVTNPVQNLRQE